MTYATAAPTAPSGTGVAPTTSADTVLLARVRLRLSAPASIAAPERAAADPGDPLAVATSLPVARDGWGDALYIPATSLAGAFRAYLGTVTDGPRLDEALMGSAPGERDETSDQQPSAVRFLGTEVTPPSVPDPGNGAQRPVPVTELRGRTAIDRRRAAAAVAALRTHELLPAGTEITLYLRLDSNDHALHTALLAALETWRPHVGGGRTIGLGRTEPVEIRHGTLDLADEDDLRRWLTLGGPALVEDVARTILTPTTAPAPGPWLHVPWRIVDALHIGSGETARNDTHAGEAPGAEETQPGTGRDPAAYAPVLRSGGSPCVPGATWKGLLRARCEFILRSVGLLAAAPGDDAPDCDASRPGGTCGRCVLCDAFGWSGETLHANSGAYASGSAASEPADPHRQAAETPVAARGRLAFADSPVADAVCTVRNHVALDRFFGGASDGLLFAQEVVESGTLALTVYDDPQRPLADPEFIKALLVLACHDINDGYLGVGGATTRGQGTLAFARPQPHTSHGTRGGGPEEMDRDYAVLVLADRRNQGPHAAVADSGTER